MAPSDQACTSVGSKFFECSENDYSFNYSFPEHIFARSAKKNFLLRSTKNVLRNTKNMLRSDPGAPKTCSGTQSHALSLSKFPGSLPNPTKSCSGAPHCSKTCSGADVTSGALPIGPQSKVMARITHTQVQIAPYTLSCIPNLWESAVPEMLLSFHIGATPC